MGKNKRPQKVLITGGASGIGRAIALIFAQNGWDIVCHYHASEKKASDLKAEVDRLKRNCLIIQADLSTKTGIEHLIKKVKKLDINCLINNAGSYITQKPFDTLSFNDILQTFSINTFCPILLTAAIFSKMKKEKFGRIVNISSIAAKYGGSSQSLHYGCSKSALEGITKTLAREGAKYNILVNTIRPGVIDTEFHTKHPKNMKKRIAMIPLKRIGTPEDVAHLTYFLGSEMNSYITNEIVTVAGGE